MRQKHFARAEQIADDVHAVHERAFDDQQRLAVFRARLLGVLVDESVDAFDERVLEAFLDGQAAPGFVHFRFGRAAGGFLFQFFAKRDEALGRVGAAVEQHVFDEFEQVLGNLLVHFQHAGVDDAHVEAGLDGVIQKRAVHRLAHAVVAAETKTKCC